MIARITLLLVTSVLAFELLAYSKDKELNNQLVLRGEVLGVRLEQLDDKQIRYRVELKLEFFNAGNQPVILLQPFGDKVFWLGGVSLSRSVVESKEYKYIYSSGAWPSVYLFPEYQELAERLDKPSPPPDVTRILKPQESWFWKTDSALILLNEKPSPDEFSFGRQKLSRQEIEKLPTPLGLRISLEMWPFNVENFKSGLGGRLRKRWSKVGILYLEEKSKRYWFGHITSEPIPLDLNSAKKK